MGRGLWSRTRLLGGHEVHLARSLQGGLEMKSRPSAVLTLAVVYASAACTSIISEYTSRMDFSKLKKLDPDIKRGQPVDAERIVTAIVKVRQENYHPDFLAVRRQISKRIFTAEFQAKVLPNIQSDPLVETVSLAETLPSY